MTGTSSPPEASASAAFSQLPQSPKSADAEPAKPSSPNAATAPDAPGAGGILPASHWIPIEGNDDADSAYNSVADSTASMRSSIREYRILHGRTYHHEVGEAEAWEPNDEQHAESMDMQDFADRYTNAQVTGTDVSAMQPTWLPPNCQFIVDDANLPWAFSKGFDFIHARMMNGTITDWAKFYREAFYSCNPGGWMESHEASFKWRSETTEIPENSAMGQWNQVFWEGGKRFGRTFRVVDDDLQQKLMKEAGFVDIVAKDIKVAFGDWPRDEQMKAAGRWAKMTLMSDLEDIEANT
ncbi:hypothetical protein N0V88_007053 [Collariella sp. IMI 366227]|nr:hypothetical protein N0V88_007053 [Collariella sp. IMI 366227]